jgi:hypothetical protein
MEQPHGAAESTEPVPERDLLAGVAEDLERAEAAGDEERLATLDRAHVRLSGELDAPAAEPLAH